MRALFQKVLQDKLEGSRLHLASFYGNIFKLNWMDYLIGPAVTNWKTSTKICIKVKLKVTYDKMEIVHLVIQKLKMMVKILYSKNENLHFSTEYTYFAPFLFKNGTLLDSLKLLPPHVIWNSWIFEVSYIKSMECPSWKCEYYTNYD